MNKTLAAVLNFLFWGIGYLYAGKRKELAILVFLGYLLVHYYWIAVVGLTGWYKMPYLTAFIGHLLISLGFAWDVYKEA